MNVRALKRLSLEMELRRAVENSSLDIYYQPKYQTHSLELLGGEALLRWFHPERGQIPTADFIAVAEETGLIGDIGRWALQRVCRDMCQWRDDGLQLPRIAVNVSGRDFMYPEALLRLGDTVTQARLSPSLFELELTEGVLMQDAEAGRRSLLALKEFGFALAIGNGGHSPGRQHLHHERCARAREPGNYGDHGTFLSFIVYCYLLFIVVVRPFVVCR